jgi:hypothetical protein
MPRYGLVAVDVMDMKPFPRVGNDPFEFVSTVDSDKLSSGSGISEDFHT